MLYLEIFVLFCLYDCVILQVSGYGKERLLLLMLPVTRSIENSLKFNMFLLAGCVGPEVGAAKEWST
jgi:hypothetical protein